MFRISHIEYSDLLIFTVILNLIMYVFMHRQRTRHSHSTVLYQRFILTVIAAGVAESLAWLVGAQGSAALRPYHYAANVLFFATNLLPAAIGLWYLDYLVFVTMDKNKKRLFLYLLPVYVNVGLIIANFFWDGLLFRVDAENVYHRGVATYIGNAFTMAFAAVVVFRFFRNRQMITGRLTQVILTLTVLPVAGAVLQMLFYGMSLATPAYTLGIFISFLLMERDELLKDPLTLLNSRTQMENRLQFKLKSQEPFTAIMIDVNDFKNINDVYGHTIGDEVLKDVSRILLSSANFEDFVCRFGGDEFFVILESTKDIGHTYIRRIDQILSEYSAHKPYTTALSYGHVYVSQTAAYEVEELLKITDRLMYQDKVSRRKAKQ